MWYILECIFQRRSSFACREWHWLLNAKAWTHSLSDNSPGDKLIFIIFFHETRMHIMKPISSMSTCLSSLEAETSCGLGALCMTTGVGLPNICKCQMGFVCGPDGSCRARTAQDVARHFDTFEEKETPETPVRNGTCPCPWVSLWFFASLNFHGNFQGLESIYTFEIVWDDFTEAPKQLSIHDAECDMVCKRWLQELLKFAFLWLLVSAKPFAERHHLHLLDAWFSWAHWCPRFLPWNSTIIFNCTYSSFSFFGNIWNVASPNYDSRFLVNHVQVQMNLIPVSWRMT